MPVQFTHYLLPLLALACPLAAANARRPCSTRVQVAHGEEA